MTPHQWLLIRSIAFASLIMLAFGCGEEPKELDELVAESTDLPGLRASKSAELHAELKRIEAEGGTPRQLLADLPPDERNVAPALVPIFDKHLLPSILSSCKNLFPVMRFEFSPNDLRQVVVFRNGHRRQLKAIAEALTRPECNFAIEYDLGYNFDPVFIDEVIATCRLLAFDVAAEMETDGPAAAVKPLGRLFQLIGHLSHAKLMSARSQAIYLRAEALLVLEAVAQHDQTTEAELRALYSILKYQLDRWPSDRNALIGDRAMVMHAYEGIRFKLLKWFLTDEEKEMFREERILSTLDETLAKTADMDELYYLRALRTLINESNKPYYKRVETFTEITNDLHRKRNKSDFPFAAARLFLPELKDWQRRCAKDRARCEGWALALAASIDLPMPPYRINPHNGLEYVVTRESLRVTVDLHEPGERNPVVPLPK